MRILFVTPYVPHPPNHGGRQRSRELIRALEKDHHVTVLAMARAGDDEKHAEALRGEGLSVKTGFVPPPSPRLSMKDRIRKWARLVLGRSSLLPRWRSDHFAAAVRREVAETSTQLVVFDGMWTAVYRPEIGNTPYLASTHNVESDVLAAAADLMVGPGAAAARRDADLARVFEASFVADAVATVAVSNDDVRRLREFAPAARLHVVENGVDVEALPLLPPPPADGPLLFVASYDYPPNADAAARFVREVLPSIRVLFGPVNVVLAGRGPGAEILDLGREPGVTVTGAVDDLKPLYEQARAVIVPLRYGGGSRLKILEAFAYGRPVISTTAGAAGLAVSDLEHLLIADDGEDFAGAMTRLRDDATLGSRLIASARTFVENRHAWPSLRAEFARVVAGLKLKG